MKNVKFSEDGKDVIFGGSDSKHSSSNYTIIGIPYRKDEILDDVERIIIKSDVREIHISNKTFPNVKEVISESTCFLSGRMLVENYNSVNRHRLLNSFFMSPGEVIDMSGINTIAKNAFVGCRSVNIINTEDVDAVNSDAFDGSAFKRAVKPCDGFYMAGTIVFAIDTSQSDYVLQKCVTAITPGIKFNKEGTIVVKNAKVFLNMVSYSNVISLPKKVIIKDIFISNSYTDRAIKKICSYGVKEFVIDNNDSDYASIDGIIYNKKTKTLCKCIFEDKADVIIPDWVEYIAEGAFARRNITSVEIPGSVKVIGREAFILNMNLSKVKMSEGVREIGAESFSRCYQLKEIDIPGSVHSIGKSAFSYCIGMNKVFLHEGLVNINALAFFGANINSIEIPSTVKQLLTRCIVNISNVTFNTETKNLPFGWVSSICNIAAKTSCGIKPVVVSTKDKTIFVPAYLRQIDANRLCSLDNDDEIFNNLYSFSTNSVSKAIHAFFECKESGYSDNIKYVSRSGKIIIDFLIKNKDEENLSSLINSGILSKNTLQYVLDNLDDDMITAKAYALNSLDKNSKKSFLL